VTKVKGSNICFAREYAGQKLSGRGFAAVLSLLPELDAKTIEGVIAAGWYELSLQHRVFVALERALAESDSGGIEGFARYVAEQDLTRVHRLFLRLRNPAFVLEQAGKYWSRFYDAGVWKIERASPTRASGDLSGIADAHEIFCRFLRAYIERMFQLAGVETGSVVHTRCCLRGAPSCLFEGSWREHGEKSMTPPPSHR
jgi:hypothetical protein